VEVAASHLPSVVCFWSVDKKFLKCIQPGKIQIQKFKEDVYAFTQLKYSGVRGLSNDRGDPPPAGRQAGQPCFRMHHRWMCDCSHKTLTQENKIKDSKRDDTYLFA
jgi:hypothetical protein